METNGIAPETINGSDIREVMDSLAMTAEIIKGLIAGLSHDDFRLRKAVEEFSVLENICHLRDIEQEGYAVRITRILEQTNPTLPDLKGKRLAEERRYNEQDPEAALCAFEAARSDNVKKVRSISDDRLRRIGVMEGVGEITLERLLRMIYEHDREHIEDIRRLCQAHIK